VLAECRVPLRLQPLQDRLLDHAIDHGWNAEVARPPAGFGILTRRTGCGW
jgi:hypothetical protein